jgi:intracellular multiplication protein IcmV
MVKNMKTGKKSRTGSFFSRIMNFRLWSDYDRTKSMTQYYVGLIKRLFLPKPKKATESFESAMSRLNLTENDLKQQQKGLFRVTIIMLIMAVLLFSYAIYHVLYGTLLAAGVSIVLTMLALVLAFRYHFWYFQIKQRKLGCSINEWFKYGVKGDKR